MYDVVHVGRFIFAPGFVTSLNNNSSLISCAVLSCLGKKKDSVLTVIFGNSSFFLKFNDTPVPSECVSVPITIGSLEYSHGNPSRAYASYYSDVHSSYWCAQDISAASMDYTFERKAGGKENIDY